ncbi:MAG: DUF433 domain-containing protein [Chloroflexota bacterium]|nr:DUF433 domain-containing protein [Chloroflexota bacterium]
MDDVIRKHIEIVDRGSGPEARIIGHRVNVSHIAMHHEQEGWSPMEIAEQLPTITLADVHAALAFYDNPDVMAAEAAADEQFYEELQRRHPSRLHEMLQQRRV